jgi:hypothetical protein
MSAPVHSSSAVLQRAIPKIEVTIAWLRLSPFSQPSPLMAALRAQR